ncbi:kinase-like domain-containing protein [Syncephalastrum racemosum]|uniref:Kinase-like domain-containing protein n=1 Tax=Syncephalastrum racemosum TaxID=13706 RepID=A0A1X2HAI0_SYNRA|nr:kinase-like domain-containing protein [Syncephalastrum racemosum]
MVSTTLPILNKNVSGRPNHGVRLDAKDTVPRSNHVIDLMELDGPALEEAVQNVVSALLPDWRSTKAIKIERVSGAMTNAVFFVTSGHKTVLLRVYGIGCDQIINRADELRWLSRLSQLHIGPRLLGIFGNGRFEEYLPSTTLSHVDLAIPSVSEQIACRMAQLHSIVRLYPPSSSTELVAWHNIDQWYAALQFGVDHPLKRAIERCRTRLATVHSPIVFAHNDAQYGNLLRLKNSQQDLAVVDFEYAGYNPRGYDVANHFCEWMYDYHSDSPAEMKVDCFPTEEQQRRFIRAYLHNNNDNKKNNNEDEVEVLLAEVQAYVMVSHLFWGLWGLLQAQQSEIDFDYSLYSQQRLDAFHRELEKHTQL